MTAYAFTRLVHVLVAVLGIGTVTAGAILTRPSNGLAPPALRSLVRVASASLGLMFLTGGLLDYFAAGAWHHMTWFRIAAVTTIAAGIALGVARRALAQAKADADPAVRRAGKAMWLAFALITVIVILMVRKP